MPAERSAATAVDFSAPRLVGADVEVPLVQGGVVRYLSLDTAASAPCLVEARDAVDSLLPWYASVRGAGYKSLVTTEAYEVARASVGRFVGARPDDVTLFTRNTTDALNLLSAALPSGTKVIVFESEHHANLLPWWRHDAIVLALQPTPEDAIRAVDAALADVDAHTKLVAFTGASNVTGELWPVRQLAEVAAAHGARSVLDGAQLLPHRPVDIADLGVDWIALSGHKLYAPFGAGALVGRPDLLESGEPYLRGGGAVKFVTPSVAIWKGLPDRQEAGTPNVLGAVALGAACDVLTAVGMDTLAAREQALVDYAENALETVPDLVRFTLWGSEHAHIGVFTFNLGCLPPSLVAAALSAEFGIGVRHGSFCAHPLMAQLLGTTATERAEIARELSAGHRVQLPAAVRASLSMTSTTADVDRFVDALTRLARTGPKWTYRESAGSNSFEPDPDPRLNHRPISAVVQQ